jgi:hypothetical protein
MPTFETRSSQLRHVAGMAARKPALAREAWESFADQVDAVRTALQEYESVELSSVSEQLGTLREALQGLAEAGAQFDGLEALSEAADAVDSAASQLGIDSDALNAFIEAYDQLESSLDTYDEYREPGSGYGPEDRESQWDEVTGYMENLADAADQLGFDWAPANPLPAGEVESVEELVASD